MRSPTYCRCHCPAAGGGARLVLGLVSGGTAEGRRPHGRRPLALSARRRSRFGSRLILSDRQLLPQRRERLGLECPRSGGKLVLLESNVRRQRLAELMQVRKRRVLAQAPGAGAKLDVIGDHPRHELVSCIASAADEAREKHGLLDHEVTRAVSAPKLEELHYRLRCGGRICSAQPQRRIQRLVMVAR